MASGSLARHAAVWSIDKGELLLGVKERRAKKKIVNPATLEPEVWHILPRIGAYPLLPFCHVTYGEMRCDVIVCRALIQIGSEMSQILVCSSRS